MVVKSEAALSPAKKSSLFGPAGKPIDMRARKQAKVTRPVRGFYSEVHYLVMTRRDKTHEYTPMQICGYIICSDATRQAMYFEQSLLVRLIREATYFQSTLIFKLCTTPHRRYKFSVELKWAPDFALSFCKARMLSISISKLVQSRALSRRSSSKNQGAVCLVFNPFEGCKSKYSVTVDETSKTENPPKRFCAEEVGERFIQRGMEHDRMVNEFSTNVFQGRRVNEDVKLYFQY